MEPKALPPAKINPAKLLKGSPLIPTVKRISAKSVVDDNRSLELGIVKRQVIQISDLIKTNTVLKAKEEERKKKESEKKRFSEREEKLEKPKDEKENKIKLPSLPRLGFLDRIKKFLFNIFLGYISLRLLPYLPKLAGVVGTIVKVQDTVIDVSGKILNGLVSFVDKAYEVHDKTRKFLGNLGGENFTKAFDGFIGAMDKVITASIVAAIAFGELRDDGFVGGKSKGPLKTGKELYKEYDPKRALIRKKYGDSFAQLYDLERAKGINSEQARKNVLSRYVGKGKITPQRMLGLGQIEGSSIWNKGLGRAPGRQITKILGRSGKKAILGTVKPFLKRLPIIGALIDFGLSVALGEDPGRAAFKSIGAALLGSVGAAVGSLAFGFGGIVGGILGSIGGDAIGGALYDMFFGNKQPNQSKIQGRAQGGQVTRGGKYTGPIKRTIKKTPPRTLKVKQTEVKPGQSVGGKDKIKKIFPEEDQTKNVNPLGYMKSSYKTASSTPGLGGLFGIIMKAQLGEGPSSADYQSAADGLTAWMQNTLGGGIQRTGGGFAGGGQVDVGMFNDNNEMRTVIAKAVQDSVAPKVDDILNDLKKQLELKAIEGKIEKQVGQPTIPTSGELAEGTIARGQITIDQLVGLAKGAGFSESDAVIMAAIAMAESGGNSNAHNAKPPDNSYGLWQINMLGPLQAERFQLFGISNNEQLKDPVVNAHAAKIIKQRSGFGAWSVYKNDRYKSYLGAAQRVAASPAITVYRQPSGGGFMPLGSEQGNLQEAKRIAESMGVPLYSHVRKKDPNSYHYDGRAMDFSNDAVGRGTPQQLKLAQTLVQRFGKSAKEIIYTPLGFSIKDGKKVAPMSADNHYNHVHVAFNKGGKVKGKMGIDQIRAMLTHGEFVLDVNSTTALEDNYPGFLDALNKADYQGALNVLKSYASYEQGATIRAIVDEKLIPVPIPVGSSQQSSMMMSIFDEVEDYMASSYKGK